MTFLKLNVTSFKNYFTHLHIRMHIKQQCDSCLCTKWIQMLLGNSLVKKSIRVRVGNIFLSINIVFICSFMCVASSTFLCIYILIAVCWVMALSDWLTYFTLQHGRLLTKITCSIYSATQFFMKLWRQKLLLSINYL